MAWFLDNLVPLIGLIASTVVVFMQMRLNRRLDREKLAYSHKHQKVTEAIDGVYNAMIDSIVCTGATLGNVESAKQFSLQYRDMHKALVEFGNQVKKTELYLDKETLDMVSDIHGCFHDHMNFCLEFSRITIDFDNEQQSRILKEKRKFLEVTSNRCLDLRMRFQKILGTNVQLEM